MRKRAADPLSRRQGRAGKTALARSLAGDGFEDTASTMGVEQRLMEVTPAALDVLGASGVWRRAEGCNSTGAISAAAAAAQAAARKLASPHTARAAAGAGAVGVAGGEISELLEGMDREALAAGVLPSTAIPPANLESLNQKHAPTGGGGPYNAGIGRTGGDRPGREPDVALAAIDRELVLKLAQDEGAGKAAGLRLSLWDYGGQKVVHNYTQASVHSHILVETRARAYTHMHTHTCKHTHTHLHTRVQYVRPRNNDGSQDM
jgi:hypothetical protein